MHRVIIKFSWKTSGVPQIVKEIHIPTINKVRQVFSEVTPLHNLVVDYRGAEGELIFSSLEKAEVFAKNALHVLSLAKHEVNHCVVEVFTRTKGFNNKIQKGWLL